MKAWIIILILAIAVVMAGGATKTPINNGILQSDLNAAGYKILSANLSDYAGVGMSWNVATNKFDSGGLPTGGTTGQALTKASNANYDFQWSTISGGAGGEIPTPLILRTTADAANPVAHPFTAANSGIFVKDATGREVLRAWASNPDASGAHHSNMCTFFGLEAGFMQPSDDTIAYDNNTAFGAGALYSGIAANCTAVGTWAMRHNTSGYANTAVGAFALQTNEWGEGITAIGTQALSASTGGGNSAVGFSALFQLTTGQENVAFGRYAGGNSVTDNGCVFLGELAQNYGVNVLQNSIAIGYQANVVDSHTAVLGASDCTDAYFGSTAGNAILHGKGAYPSGGTTGQVLAKNSNANYDVGWVTPTAYQAADTDLTTWAGITPVAAVGTWIATPSSANLISAVTDETGTGALVFGTSPSLTTPKIVTSLTDTNGNTLLGVTATGSAVNYLTLANSATSTVGGTIAADGTGTNLDIKLSPKGTGRVYESANPGAGARNEFVLDNTQGANKSSVYAFYASGTKLWEFGNDAGLNGTSNFYIWQNGGSGRFGLLGTGSTSMALFHPNTMVGWNSGAATNMSTPDTGFSRNAAGVVEVNTGTTGTFATLKADKVNAVTGFQINGAATTGAILQGNGTNFVASTPTYPTTAGTTGYLIRSDGTNFTSYPNQQTNSSVTNQSFTTSDTYLTNSSCVVAAGDFKAKGQYRCVFDMVKSAGTGAIVIQVRIGTAGTTSDASKLTFTFGAGTSVADSGVFDVVVNWRTVGSGTSAVVQGICRGTHNLATTGLFNNAAGWIIIGTPSGGFDSSTATTIGLSFNGATAFAGTNSLTQAQLQQ